MQTQAISTEYILNKLSKNKYVSDHLTEPDIEFIKNSCKHNVPKKIVHSSQIKPFIVDLVREILKRKQDLLSLFIDNIIDVITKEVCCLIDNIVIRRRKLNKKQQKKTKRLQTTTTATMKKKNKLKN